VGADGRILIWQDHATRKVWPDCDKLFACFPNHYVHELGGVKYHHGYEGSNEVGDWNDESYWCGAGLPPDMIRRLRKFVEWLEFNNITWEVWT